MAKRGPLWLKALSLFRTTSGEEISAPGLQEKTKTSGHLDKTLHDHDVFSLSKEAV